MLRLHRSSAPSREDLFIERYERLRGRALQLTAGDQERAEDLLHDAFIHFTLNHTPTQDIHNLDAYLYTMLRNLYLSEARRSARTPQGHVSILDYESAEAGLRSVDPRDQIKAQDELRAICHYVCVRKETSKAGSVLILRFFHGYYPSEIARILRTPRASVDNLLKTARGEARLFRENPDGLAFMRKGEARRPTETGFGRVAPDILAELRHAIFQSRRGECSPVDDLERLFTNGEPAPIEAGTLSHLVSCHPCLGEVNRLLRLPPLTSRQGAEATAPDKRSKGGDGRGTGGGSGGAPSVNSFLKKSRRRAKQVFEHRPKELRISVNGFVLGEQRISSELSELTLSVSLDERIGFIEVYSERDVRLFFLSIEPPPDGPVEQLSRVELSDGRALDLTLNFSDTWPKLRAVYHDPLLHDAVQQSEAAAEDFSPQKETGPQQATGGDQSAATNVRRLLSSIARAWRWITGKGLWGVLLRPAAVTAIFALLLIAALMFARLQRSPIPTVSAAELLRQAATADESIAARADQVLHRTINLEERFTGGKVIARRRIEVWQSAARGLTVRRLYDEHGGLIAGDWRRADGVQTIYRHGAPPQLQLAPEKRGVSESPGFADVWQLSPSAKDFNALIGGGDRARIEEKATSYVISYANTEDDGNAQGLLKATLVLSRADLHASEQTLLVRQGSELREYRFMEASFERHAPSTVAPAVFEPDRELLVLSEKSKDEGVKDVSAAKPLSLSSNLLPPRVVATAALEVEVLRLLNQAGADMGEQVSVARTAGGQLKVQGIVETDKRKTEILSALAPVTSNPAVEVEIQTIDEAVARQQKSESTSGAVTARQVEMSNDSIPAGADLRRYFGKGDGQDTEEVRRFASRMISRSSRAMSHAAALKRLINQFSAEDLRTLAPEARAKWLTLIRNHARAFQSETVRLRQDLRPIFFPAAPPDAPQDGARITDDADLSRAIARLFELGSANDEAIRSAFSISPSDTDALAIKTPQFWRSLRDAEAVAERIQGIR
jgi:RNA polymerase sigma factor (sigma-70 family)